MKFIKGNLYRNIYRDKDMAFSVNEIISQNHNGAELIVSWYKLNDKKQYLSTGIDGDFFISKDEIWHYVVV